MLGLFEKRRPDWTHQRLSYSVSHTSTHTPRSTLDGSRVQISRNQFGLIWSKLSPWVYRPCLGGPSLASWFSNSWAHFLIWTNWFSLQKCCHAFSLDLPLLVWDPHLKAAGPIYGSPPIRLLYFIGPLTLDLGPWSKVALTAFCTTKKNISSSVFHRVLTGCQKDASSKALMKCYSMTWGNFSLWNQHTQSFFCFSKVWSWYTSVLSLGTSSGEVPLIYFTMVGIIALPASVFWDQIVTQLH
jgi:hypothetical protein